MNFQSGEIPHMVFRRLPNGDLKEFTFDRQMLSVLVELDGQKSLSSVSKKTGFKLMTVKEIIIKLMDLKLVTPVKDAMSVLHQDFFEYLNAQLAKAVGPISEILIEESVEDLGYTVKRFPSPRAAELVDLISRHINGEEKKIHFKHSMLEKIREAAVESV
jgi:hypothetical protein